MQYNEVYRIITRHNGVETFTELHPDTTESEALDAWDRVQRTTSADGRSVVTLVRIGAVVIASASRC